MESLNGRCQLSTIATRKLLAPINSQIPLLKILSCVISKGYLMSKNFVTGLIFQVTEPYSEPIKPFNSFARQKVTFYEP
jgi:hypothetical protein